MSTALVALVDLSSQSWWTQSRSEHEARAKYIFEGSLAQIRYQQEVSVVDPSWPQMFFVNGQTVTTTLVDLDPMVPLCARIDQQLSIAGRIYTNSTVIGYPALTYNRTLWSNVLAVNGDLSFQYPINANGNVYANSISDVSNNSVFNRTVKVRTGFIPPGLKVKGKKVTHSPSIVFPVPRSGTYLESANLVLTGNQTITSYDFNGGGPPTTIHGPITGYPQSKLVYINGDLTISGPIVGSGTFFVTGNVHIVGNITDPKKADMLAIIAQGDIDVDQSAAAINKAFLFAGGTLNVNNPLTIRMGGVIAQDFNSLAPITISSMRDIAKRRGNTVLYDLKLPGVWP